MRHILFKQAPAYQTAIIVPTDKLIKQSLVDHYVDYLVNKGIKEESLIAFNAKRNENNKTPVGFVKNYLNTSLLPALNQIGVTSLYVCDGEYFKALTGEKKVEPHYGYVLPCKMKGYEHMSVALGINYGALFYNPALIQKKEQSLDALVSHLQGNYIPVGQDIIHSASYPDTLTCISDWLIKLKQYPVLTCDIEAFDLKFYKAGIGTIGFAWDQHNGIAFPVEFKSNAFRHMSLNKGYRAKNKHVKYLLKKFFEEYTGKIIWHNAGYDIKVLIYELFMKHPLDTEGLLYGLEVMTRNFEDTQVITYLATNSCAGNKLSLKEQSQEFSGNYAQEDIDNICRIEQDKLLKYNLVDCLSTWYVYNKHYPTMVADQQKAIYEEIMKPSVKLLLHIELVGMPIDMDRVRAAKKQLEQIIDTAYDKIIQHPAVDHAMKVVRLNALLIDFEKRKSKAKNPQNIKQKPADAFDHITFNPRSPVHLQALLYDVLGLPVIDLTDKKQPAVGAKTIEKLQNHLTKPDEIKMLEALISYGKANKILTAFIPAFEDAWLKPDGVYYLHGSFKLGGTVSGRLSCKEPNLQQIPSGSTFAKLIKSCFMAGEGWIFSGADFNSLEDYISALTTKDPNKLKVYEQGFDGHCLRAANYFRDEVPSIDLDDPTSVNSLKKSHPVLRQDSKGPTFALTYQGTWHTLVNNLGWPQDKAKKVEAGYHEMYKVSDEWVKDKLDQASKDGYVTVAFGLRLRTPLLKQCLMNHRVTPYEASAEGRTAGNALGQSYGLLNNRAAIEFMERVYKSPYKLDIKPVALIHDAIYLLIRDDVEVVKWVNDNLVDCMQWQELPEIQHDTVKLGAELDLFWPSWAESHTLPNGASVEQIIEICKKD